MDNIYLIGFTMIVWAIIGAVVTPFVFARRGRSTAVGFLFGTLFGALAGILLLGPLWFFMPVKKKKCPQCAERIQFEALVCKNCNYRFDPRQVKAQVMRRRREHRQANIIVFGLAGFAIIAIVVIVALAQFIIYLDEREEQRIIAVRNADREATASADYETRTAIAAVANANATATRTTANVNATATRAAIGWTPIERDFDGLTMVLAPADCFIMRGESGHQCIEAPFWIDKYEVTNAAYARFIEAGGYNNPDYWTAGWQTRQDEGWTQPRFWDDERLNGDNQPVVGVSWYEALAYATWRGGRLPNETEWEYAVRGPGSWVYPWGNEFNSDNLVYRDNSNNQPANVGSRPDGASWLGALDLRGNVWEWCSSRYSYPGRLPVGASINRRVLRGGAFDDDRDTAWAATRSVPGDLHDRHSSYGFRVVRPYEY